MVARINHAPGGWGDVYTRLVAVGDSFTEGLDDLRPDGTYRGWADLVATELAARNPQFRYANLAVRGRRLRRIRDEQVPVAMAMGADLVTLAAGGNDIIGFRCDVARLTRDFRESLHMLAGTGATVVVFTGFDPRGRLPMGRLLAARAALYNQSLVTSAAEVGAHVVDLWHLPDLYHAVMWAPDRLHLSADGHALVAAEVLRAIGVAAPDEPVSSPVDQSDVRRQWVSARRADAEWVRTYFAPWIGRQLRGRSTGDLIEPKFAELTTLPLAEIDLRGLGVDTLDRRSP